MQKLDRDETFVSCQSDPDPGLIFSPLMCELRSNDHVICDVLTL